jgi:DNA-binding GntR family transcriptional regulator
VTIGERIKGSEAFKLGYWFTAEDMAAELGTCVNSTRKALWSLSEQGQIQKNQRRKYRPAKYRSRGRHWIFQARLCDPDGLRVARESLTRTVGGA